MANVIYMGVVVPLTILLPIGIGLVKYKQCSTPLKIIFYYLLLDGIVNLAAIYLADLHVRNLPLLHVFTALEFMLLSYYYFLVFPGRMVRMVLKCLMLAFPLYCIFNCIFFQSIYHFNTNTRPVELLIIMACSLAYFAKTNDDTERWPDNPLNWVNTGMLLYFSGALFIFSFSNLASSQMSARYSTLNSLMWNIHATLVLIMYLLFSVGFIKCRKH